MCGENKEKKREKTKQNKEKNKKRITRPALRLRRPVSTSCVRKHDRCIFNTGHVNGECHCAWCKRSLSIVRAFACVLAGHLAFDIWNFFWNRSFLDYLYEVDIFAMGKYAAVEGRLIAEVERHPVIWQPTDPNFKNKASKENAWSEIADIVNSETDSQYTGKLY